MTKKITKEHFDMQMAEVRNLVAGLTNQQQETMLELRTSVLKKEFVSMKEAAYISSLSTTVLREHVKKGYLKYADLGIADKRFRLKDIECLPEKIAALKKLN